MSGQFLASDEARDTVAEWIGGVLDFFFSGFTRVFTDPPFALGALIGILALWIAIRLSLIFGPKKICFWCKGKGYKKSLFIGVRVCGACNGDGIRDRFGAKK